MLVKESILYKKIKSHQRVELGELFFFETYFIAEFNEGVNIDFDNFEECEALIKEHFKDKDFGFISNRVNSYSIVLTDAPLFNKTFHNLKAYATVTYSIFAEKVFEVEKHFFKFNKRNFNNLMDAVAWVQNN